MNGIYKFPTISHTYRATSTTAIRHYQTKTTHKVPNEDNQ
jgi:hypothetical protein